MTDLKKLREGLEQLRGFDLEAAEREERMTGNQAAILDTSKSFQIRLAARALGVNVNELRELPIKEYERITLVVNNFLLVTDAAS